MNKNQDKGSMDKVKGKAKEWTGKITGNRTQEAKGKVQQAKGSVQKGVGDVQAEAERERQQRPRP